MNEVIECDVIRKFLPHRFPFLLLDRVVKLVPGAEATGLKNVTINEPFFQGHFPSRAIMPGVLIVEALAQLTVITCASKILAERGILDFNALATRDIDPEEIAARVGYLAEVNVKFKKPVIPGDQLYLRSVLGKSLGALTQVMVSATVGNTVVAEGKLVVSERI